VVLATSLTANVACARAGHAVFFPTGCRDGSVARFTNTGEWSFNFFTAHDTAQEARNYVFSEPRR